LFPLTPVPLFRINKLLFLLAGILLACQPQASRPPTEVARFAKIYTDYIIAADLSEKEDMAALLDSVLAVHAFSKKEFRDNLQYYTEHPQEWEAFLEAVIQQLTQRAEVFEAENLKEKLKTPPLPPKIDGAKPRL